MRAAAAACISLFLCCKSAQSFQFFKRLFNASVSRPAEQQQLCQRASSPHLSAFGKGTLAGLCESRPTFYELCSGARRTHNASAGGNDKCLLPAEWDRPNADMLYSPGSDLIHPYHSGHSYEQLYPLYLSPLRYRHVRLLEIGSFRGDSLRLWCRYFVRPSNFALVDLQPQWESLRHVANESCRKHSYSIHAADQGSRSSLLAAVQAADAEYVQRSQNGDRNARHSSLASGMRDEPFDVIIDDGSHQCLHIVRSFNALFPKLRPGGVYIIEDLNAQYADSVEQSGCHQFIKALIDFLHTRLHKQTPTGLYWPDVTPGSIASVNCIAEACAVVRSLRA